MEFRNPLSKEGSPLACISSIIKAQLGLRSLISKLINRMWEFSGIFWQKFYKPMSPTHEVKRTKKNLIKRIRYWSI
ncbi:uncharacterized protein METZ01_LOCUS486078 [marine metagenome]|uniref:Uncharacterized protein n=1 Tax=marine metagenome TaxID=408172 RepID=A0A383CM67_9ZZZZ